MPKDGNNLRRFDDNVKILEEKRKDNIQVNINEI